jgi:hypothetical protein
MPAGAPRTHVSLVVVFNHRFDQVLAKLRALYARRFSRVTFLVPCYDGSDPDVVGVIENSKTFQGYFAQALPRLRDPGASHLAFLADDAVLAPDLDEENLAAVLGLEPGAGYLKSLRGLAAGSFKWANGCDAVRCLASDPGYARYAPLLPAPEAFAERLARHGVDTARHFDLRSLRSDRSAAPVNAASRLRPYRGVVRDALELAPSVGTLRRVVAARVPVLGRLARSALRRRELPVPVASGYSDFAVVPAPALDEFVRLCQVFAAMRLFAEVAIPTALALAVDRIVVEEGRARAGLELWEAEQIRALEERCGRSVARLPREPLYIHPIKLSRWTLAGEGA